MARRGRGGPVKNSKYGESWIRSRHFTSLSRSPFHSANPCACQFSERLVSDRLGRHSTSLLQLVSEPPASSASPAPPLRPPPRQRRRTRTLRPSAAPAAPPATQGQNFAEVHALAKCAGLLGRGEPRPPGRRNKVGGRRRSELRFGRTLGSLNASARNPHKPAPWRNPLRGYFETGRA